MPGTVIEGTKLTKVVDGDTVKVEIDGKEESLRLCCLDTEESWPGGSKPVTKAGQLASKWAKQYFGVGDDGFPTCEILVNIEFDTKDPVNVCLKKHRGNFGRLICYIYKGAENYNLKTTSPFFATCRAGSTNGQIKDNSQERRELWLGKELINIG